MLRLERLSLSPEPLARREALVVTELLIVSEDRQLRIRYTRINLVMRRLDTLVDLAPMIAIQAGKTWTQRHGVSCGKLGSFAVRIGEGFVLPDPRLDARLASGRRQ